MLISLFPFFGMVFRAAPIANRTAFGAFLALVAVFLLAIAAIGQEAERTPYISQEISDEDQVPVLIKHLPDWESVYAGAVFTDSVQDLRAALGEQPVFSELELVPGTEAVTARYPAGGLLIIEYTSPQAASHADARIMAFLMQQAPEPPVTYRRIGNYSAFVFDAPERDAANALLDQIKYEKSVQWLGEDPFLLQKLERYFASTGRDVALSTVMFISFVFLTAIVIGIIGGFLFFRMRQQKRASQAAFSDAGGLTRLNLDELSEPLQLKSR